MMTIAMNRQRMITIAFLLVFMGSGAAGIARIFNTLSSPQPADTNPNAAPTQEQDAQAQAKGYEIVLSREPHNQVALEGLVTTRLAMNDAKGAIAPLETLVKLHPDRTDYITQLKEAQAKLKGDLK